MLVEGLTSSEISQNLNLSIKTVSTYRTRLLQKMNLKNNVITSYSIHYTKLYEIVGLVEYRDGTIIDTVRQVKALD